MKIPNPRKLIGTRVPKKITEDTIHKAKVLKRKREINKVKLDIENGCFIETDHDFMRLWRKNKLEPEPKKSFWKWLKDTLCELKP